MNQREYSTLKSPGEIELDNWYKRYAKLQADAACNIEQINGTLIAVDRNTLESQQDAIFAEMNRVYKKIEELESQNQNPIQQQFELEKNLTKIDFSEANEIINCIFEQLNRAGGGVLFLLQNSYSMAGDLCLTTIRDRLTQETRDFKPFPIDLASRHSEENEYGLLNAIAEKLQPIEAVPDLEQYARLIIKKICSSLQSGSVVFFELKKWDDLQSPARLLNWFIDRFWLPLIEELPTIAQNYRKVRFVVVVSAEAPLSEDFQNLPCCDRHNFDCRRMLELPLDCWTQDEIADWLDMYSGLPANRIDRLARRIYRISNEGIPELVRSKLRAELEEYR